MTARSIDRRLWVASAAAEDVLEERALLRSILQHIRTRVTLARDLAHEMERRRPAQAQFRARGEAPLSVQGAKPLANPGKPGRQAPPRRESN